MNRNQFLSELRDNLNGFPYDERESAIAYYTEFFEDAGADNEQAVIASLGDPKELAKTILKESGINTEDSSQSNPTPTFTPPQTAAYVAQSNNSNGTRTALIILLVVVTFPVWIGFVAGAFGILVGLLCIPFALLIAFIAVCVSTLAFGIYNLFIDPSIAITSVGVGLISLGLIILVISPLIKVVIKGFKALFQGIGRLFKNIFGGRSVN